MLVLVAKCIVNEIQEGKKCLFVHLINQQLINTHSVPGSSMINKTQSIKELWCPVRKRNMQISSKGNFRCDRRVQCEKEGRVYSVWRCEDSFLELSSLHLLLCFTWPLLEYYQSYYFFHVWCHFFTSLLNCKIYIQGVDNIFASLHWLDWKQPQKSSNLTQPL